MIIIITNIFNIIENNINKNTNIKNIINENINDIN